MTLQNGNDVGPEQESISQETAKNSFLRAAWMNNQGAILILLAEAVGSSMDATVRFLQQGGHGMHPFQVGSIPKTKLKVKVLPNFGKLSNSRVHR